jgi:hypothetical protein
MQPSSKRNYKEEYARWHSSPEDRKRRSSRNKARRKMIKWGKIRKGDPRDVDHVSGNPLSNSRKNLRATSVKFNRGRNNNKGH